MLKKLAQSFMALALVIGMTASTIQPAEARGGRFAAGVAAGIIGLGLLGAYGHARGRHYSREYYRASDECYPGPEQCGWVDRHCFRNSWGDRVCRGGRWTCWRQTYCD